MAEAVRGIGEPAEVAVGAAAQRLLGSRHFVLERLQFGDTVQEIGELAILGTDNLGTVVQIGMGSCVLRDVGAGVFAFGNPLRSIDKIDVPTAIIKRWNQLTSKS